MERFIDKDGFDTILWYHKDGRRQYWLIKAWLNPISQPDSTENCIWDFSIYRESLDPKNLLYTSKIDYQKALTPDPEDFMEKYLTYITQVMIGFAKYPDQRY